MNPKEQILIKASQLFFKRGYISVLMADIAKEMGMSKKTLYQYFSGKEELVLEVIKIYLQEMQKEVEQLLQNDALLFPDKVSLIFKYIAKRIQGINPQFIEDLKQNSPKSWLLIQEYKADAAYLRFNSLLEEGTQKGYLRKDINPALAVLLYASALDAIMNPLYTHQIPNLLAKEQPYATEAVFDGIVSIIFHGILNRNEN